MRIWLLLILLVLSGVGFTYKNGLWKPVDRLVFHKEPTVIRALSLEDKEFLYVAVGGDVFQSSDNGHNWERLFHAVGPNSRIQDIYIPSQHFNEIYLPTTDGLYHSFDNGRHWRRLFLASDDKQSHCLSVLKTADSLYMGTEGGAFVKKDNTDQWKRLPGLAKDTPIYQIIPYLDNILFVSTRKVLILEQNGAHLKTLWDVGAGLISETEEIINNPKRLIRDLIVTEDGGLLIASERGIYQKIREDFKRLPSNGLPLKDITSIAFQTDADCADEESCSNIIIGTQKGVFVLQDDKWVLMYQGMPTNRVYDIVLNSEHSILSLTDMGIFTLALYEEEKNPISEKEFQEGAQGLVEYKQMVRRFDLEPRIQQVHDMAIQYADVHPEKILEWKQKALKKAWLPTVSLGVDGSHDWGASDSVYGSSSSGGSHYVGPDDKSWGEDLGWDVSLSWDFADLVWSSDQISIDNRSKLMVELREDILDQVTRLYFERRRAQFELIEAVESEPRIRIEKEMRVAELTALIDALTGGRFSERIIKNNNASTQKKAITETVTKNEKE
ncbi:MAG: hypothetical protein KC618_04120 [Candidatus Omnitrophica bacterium]|nr:hypothetical protein [Candidatus Omnitrophota bacterium]